MLTKEEYDMILDRAETGTLPEESEKLFPNNTQRAVGWVICTAAYNLALERSNAAP